MRSWAGIYASVSSVLPKNCQGIFCANYRYRTGSCSFLTAFCESGVGLTGGTADPYGVQRTQVNITPVPTGATGRLGIVYVWR